MRAFHSLAMVVAIASGTAATAWAAENTVYYHSGSWDAFSGRTDKGQLYCGVGTTNSSDGRNFSMRFDIGGQNVSFAVAKPNWAIPPGTKVSVVLQVDNNPPWTEQAEGNGHELHWSIDSTTIQTFDGQFRAGQTMTVSFPNGNEPPWRLSLSGSTAISNTFGRCVTDLTQRVGGAAPPPANTQPFSGPPADAPNDAAPEPASPPPAPQR